VKPRRPDPLIAMIATERATVRRAVVRAGVGESDVDDVTGAVILKACELVLAGRLVIAHEGNERVVVRAWLSRVAWRIAKQWKRAAVHHVELDDVAGPDAVARLEAREELRRVLGRFNRSERALMADVVAGHTVAEIAAEGALPPGTVATRVRRIRRLLRR
jgi:DNA-directed RNA polymerase specialized sigma24 family protein